MSRMRRTLLALLLCVVPIAPLDAGPIRDDERTRLLEHLRMTEAWLASELDGLTDAQLRHRTAPESWSIRDVVEHLAIAEPQYWDHLQQSLKAATVAGYTPEATDAGILWYGIDRSQRHKTGEARVPTGKYESARDALAAFRALRKTMTEFASTTGEDLRGRPLKDGNMDVYQWFLMISSHAQRHVLQIREIKAHAGYPR
jgi:hypothetical protein